MTQNPGQWGPQGGYPPQGQGGYPQQQPPPGYPPQPGYNPQGTYAPPGGYPPQTQPAGYGPPGQQPPAGYGPQGAGVPPGGMPPGGFPPQGAPPAKKSPGLIIGIVVAAVVLLAAIGGIIMVLNRDGGDQPTVSITPTEPVPPTDPPTPGPTPQPTPGPTTPGPEPTPTPGPPSGDAVDLGKGISLTPAAGWQVQKTGNGVAQLSNGQSIFLGQVIQAEAATNPGQLCDAWHRKVAEGTSNGKFGEPKSEDLGTQKLKGASCGAQVTVSNGQGSATLLLVSLVSVRSSDGVTVIGTVSFSEGANTDQLSKDFTAMVNSMLQGQASG